MPTLPPTDVPVLLATVKLRASQSQACGVNGAAAELAHGRWARAIRACEAAGIPHAVIVAANEAGRAEPAVDYSPFVPERCPVCGGLRPDDVTHARCQ